MSSSSKCCPLLLLYVHLTCTITSLKPVWFPHTCCLFRMSSLRISVLADACSTMRLISSSRLARSAATAADQEVERAETGQQTAGNNSCSVGPSHGTAQLSIPAALPPQDAANRSHHMQQVIVLEDQHSRIFIVKIHHHSQEQQPPAT